MSRRGGAPTFAWGARTVAAALCAVGLAGCGESEHVVGANWIGPADTPHGREFTPEQAIAHDVAGWVLLRCSSGEDQSARDCSVLAETPGGWGFAESALRASAQTRITSADHFAGGHVPVPGERFNLPIVFCPPRRQDTCPPEMRAQIAAFVAQMASIDRALRGGDCAAATREAAATNMPALVARIRAQCDRRAQ